MIPLVRTVSGRLASAPALRVPALFACSLSRLGLAKWLGRGRRGIGVVFDVSMRGAKVMSGSRNPARRSSIGQSVTSQSGLADDGRESHGAGGSGAGLRFEFVDLSPVAGNAFAKVHLLATKPAA